MVNCQTGSTVVVLAIATTDGVFTFHLLEGMVKEEDEETFTPFDGFPYVLLKMASTQWDIIAQTEDTYSIRNVVDYAGGAFASVCIGSSLSPATHSTYSKGAKL